MFTQVTKWTYTVSVSSSQIFAAISNEYLREHTKHTKMKGGIDSASDSNNLRTIENKQKKILWLEYVYLYKNPMKANKEWRVFSENKSTWKFRFVFTI